MAVKKIKSRPQGRTPAGGLDDQSRSAGSNTGSTFGQPLDSGFHTYLVEADRTAKNRTPSLLFLSESKLPADLRQWVQDAWPVPVPGTGIPPDPFEVEINSVILDSLLDFMRSLSDTMSKSDQGLVMGAFVIAHLFHEGVTRKSGEPYILHPIAVASILVELGMDKPAICAALLHDVGQMSMSERVLSKPGILSVEELGALHLHPIYSRDVVAGISGLEEVAEWVEAHHERIDGRGYPEGRTGEEIPFESRILAVADAYVAITSERPHRPKVEGEEARERLKHAAGTQLDSALVDAFLRQVV